MRGELDQATGSHDVIIIGGGTAGPIVAAKLQTASGGRKRILIIEAGGTIMAVADRAGDILAARWI